MQARAALDEDMEGLTGCGVQRRSEGPSRRIVTPRLIAEAVGGVCLLALLCWVVALSARLRSLQSIAPECVHALGGGPVAPGGSLHPVTAEHCTAQLRTYAQGPYWREVELAAGAAMQGLIPAVPGIGGSSSSMLRQRPAKQLLWTLRSLLTAARAAAAETSSSSSSSSRERGPSSSGGLGGPRHCGAAGDQPGLWTVAEAAAASATSTAASQQQLQQQGEARPLVVFDIDETLLSNMPQILDPEAWPWEQWVAAAQAEPLQPMLQLYAALCSHGYSIALVTGRRESSRNSTMANLQRAGYGKLCSAHSSRISSSSSRISSSSAHASCCYDALLMRPASDTRLASVYKPWARAQLLAGGRYVLAALLGDQFSDINGGGVDAGSGVQAYKLPNPFYYIL